MAAQFNARIIDITGAFTDTAAIAQFIADGCHDVFRRAVMSFGANERHKFATDNALTAASVEVDEFSTITGVTRDGIVAIEGDWDKKAKYADSSSIYFATNSSPIYYIDDKSLYVLPACADSAGNRGAWYAVPIIASVGSTDDAIDGFPAEYYDAVVLFASAKVLHRKMVDVVVPTELSSLSISSVPPDEPTLATINYTPPSAITVTETADISVADIVAVDNASVSSITGASSNQPTYVAPAPPERPDFEGSVTAEDEDILQMKVQQYQADLSEYQASIGDSVNEFQENVAIYNQLVAQATQNANATNQANIQNMQKDLQINQANNQKLVQQAQTNQQEEIQRNLQNASNAQAKAMQDAIQQVQDTIANNQSLLNEYQAKVGTYQAEVGTETQEFSINLQKFNADLQSKNADYAWLESQYTKVQGEYLSQFPQPSEGA
mgnify:CR=1 FL=1|tara:strand:+ start:12824 stop:14137 length:1314 start_codon:yes stop_codon:yes gene_type:complete